MTEATDELHIGNRWLGHSGLAMYDNTARMHDPLLMRFVSPDPLYAKFGSLSPYTHCAADPLNIIDPLGEDNWQLDDRGYFSLVETTDDEFDTILGQDGASILVEKGFINPIIHEKGISTNEISKGEEFMIDIYKCINNGQKIFEFLAENSHVEWSNVRLTSGYNYIGTSHDEHTEGSVFMLSELLPEEFYRIIKFDHSHPSNSLRADNVDLEFTKYFKNHEFPVTFRIYAPTMIPGPTYVPDKTQFYYNSCRFDSKYRIYLPIWVN